MFAESWSVTEPNSISQDTNFNDICQVAGTQKSMQKIQRLKEDLLKWLTCGLQQPCSRDIKMDIEKLC